MRTRPMAPTAHPARGGMGSRWWQLGVWLFLGVGVLASIVGAAAWHSTLKTRDRAAFQARASDLAISVGSGLSRDTDFMASLQSLVATTPQLTQARFAQAISAVGAAQRYPGGVGYDYFEHVTAAQLPAFLAEVRADPPEGLAITSAAQIDPPGPRASYCLTRFSDTIARLSGVGFPAGLDVCVPGGLLGTISLSGQSSQDRVVLIAKGLKGIVGIGAPVYAGGVVPSTAAGRQAAFTGWIGGTFAAAGLIPMAAIPRGLQITVLFRNAGAQPLAVATSGPAPPGRLLTQDLQVSADGPWTVRVEGAATGAGASWTEARVLGGAGLLLTALLFGFLQVLALSRRHALRQVQKRTAELHHQALHDTLTGLPNRALILDRAEQMLVRGRRDHLPVAALFMDLDGFKDVNDTYGHATGDRLLQAVAERISSTLRPQDTAGRLGGDEFVVLVDGVGAGPDLLAQRLLSVLHEPFLLDVDDQVYVTAQTSIGIAAGNRGSAGELLRDADIALYQAKGEGGNRYATFSPGMQTDARDRVELGMELRHALDAGEFFLNYQPTFSLRDMSVTGVEALIRWQHPTRGIVSPDDFIPLTEETRLIVPIGRWVLNTACEEAASWQTADRRLSIAVNVSGRQLDSPGLVDDVRAALHSSGLDPSLLTLEITETALMHDAEAATVHIAALKHLGVKIAIDDFGTGYSSLTYLRRFRADAIKIDRSFITAMDTSPESVVIVRTLVQLGKALGIQTLAEGIEERHQLRHLQMEDCDSGQGFLFARPLSPEALRLLLAPVPAAAGAAAAAT
jgi:diguanylate cyclase (GGDEF)-like protein